MLRIRNSKESGLAILEFTLVIIPLVIFCFQMFDVSNLLYHHAVLTQLAREGVRFAGQDNSASPATLRIDIQNKIDQALDGSSPGLGWDGRLSFAPGTVQVPVAYPIITGENITVRIEGNYAGLFFPWTNFQIAAEATGPKL